MVSRRLVVVGAALAGHRISRLVHQRDESISITLLGDEKIPPYQRPPLSKQILTGEFPASRAMLRGSLDGIEVILGERALGVDLDTRTLHTATREYTYDDLVIATGARPRLLDALPPSANVIYFRTLTDCLTLKDRAHPGSRITLVGGGFIGLEVAASLGALGAKVTVVEREERFLTRACGPAVARTVLNWHAAHGVQMHSNCTVTRYENGLCEDETGRSWPADTVVVGIGIVPNTDWLPTSILLHSDGGIVTAATGIVQPHVHAAGDVASWYHPKFGRHFRVEHFDAATTHASVIAHNLTQTPLAEIEDLPFGWSDQYGHTLQFLGMPGGDQEFLIRRDGDAAVYGYRQGQKIVGAVGIDAPEYLEEMRRIIEHDLTETGQT